MPMSMPVTHDADPAGHPATFTLSTVDDDKVYGLSFPELLAEIGEIDPQTMDEIRLLAPGATSRQGGGAAPVWSVTREVAPMAVAALTEPQRRALPTFDGADVETCGGRMSRRLRLRGFLEFDHSGPRLRYRMTRAGRAAIDGAT